MYKVNEIFYSIQGEGRYTGFPTVFVRFSGCNKKCIFCDTEHNTGEMLSANDILFRIHHFGASGNHRVTFTGGEPLLQLDEELVDLLHKHHYTLHLETNGSIKPNFIHKIDWVTVSPKDFNGEFLEGNRWVDSSTNNWNLDSGDELKIVYQGEDYIAGFLHYSFKYYYLQPCSMKNVSETVEKVKEDPRWNLSIQQQKILDIR